MCGLGEHSGLDLLSLLLLCCLVVFILLMLRKNWACFDSYKIFDRIMDFIVIWALNSALFFCT